MIDKEDSTTSSSMSVQIEPFDRACCAISCNKLFLMEAKKITVRKKLRFLDLGEGIRKIAILGICSQLQKPKSYINSANFPRPLTTFLSPHHQHDSTLLPHPKSTLFVTTVVNTISYTTNNEL